MTPKQNRGAGKRRPPAVPLNHYDLKAEQRDTKLFFVFYNGKVTECMYLDALISSIGKNDSINSQILRLKFVEGTPQQVVDAARREIDKRRSSDEKTDDIVWVVFDKDDFGDNYSQAVRLAIDFNFGAAYSNICFELWLSLHFRTHNPRNETKRSELMDFLRSKTEEVSKVTVDRKRQIKRFSFGILYKHGDQKEAIKRAEELCVNAEDVNQQMPWDVNPVTNVHKLVKSLRDFLSKRYE